MADSFEGDKLEQGFPSLPSQQEIQLTELIGQSEQIGAEKVPTAVERLAEAARNISLTPEASQKLSGLHQKMDLAESPGEKKRIWLEFVAENSKLLDQVLELQNEPGESENSEQAKEFGEQLEVVQESVIRNLQAEVKRILQNGELDPNQKTELLRSQLGKMSFPPAIMEGLVSELMSEGLTPEKIDQLVSERVKNNFIVVLEGVHDQGEYRKFGKKLSGIKSIRESDTASVFKTVDKANKDFLEDVGVENMIDLIFAVDHGFGSRGFRDLDSRSEKTDEVKERETLGVLNEVLSHEKGAKVFFACLQMKEEGSPTDSQIESVFQSRVLIDNLDSVLSPGDLSSQERLRTNKAKISLGVKTAVEKVPELYGVTLPEDKINLSKDVWRLVYLKAREHLEKNKAGE
jgi:hypothetical protein